MEELIMSELFSNAFPTAWAVLSLILFGKNVFTFVNNKYHDHGMYEPDANSWITRIAVFASLIFLFFSFVDFTGLASLLAKWLTSDPFMEFLLSYLLRWLIAAVVDFIFYAISWSIYRHRYIERSIYT